MLGPPLGTVQCELGMLETQRGPLTAASQMGVHGTGHEGHWRTIRGLHALRCGQTPLVQSCFRCWTVLRG
eukprot:13513813-Alexandrium_andersonii.AAC.1